MTKPNPHFSTTVHGKWILAGEHAVLRGHPAIIFPVTCKSMELHHWPSTEEAGAEFSGDYGEEMQLLFWSTLERALQILGLPHSYLNGKFAIANQIPIGTGMGASAALCVAIGNWFIAKGKLAKRELLEFARELENLFHSESSGADIAVAIAGKGILFSRKEGSKPITTAWSPQWYLSFSDKVSTTARCVKKVKELWRKNLSLATQIDAGMAESVALAIKALGLNEQDGLDLLASAVEKARHCFQRWGLIEGNVDRHITRLLEAGAIAAKPTGSGNGGYVLSLWERPPPDTGFEMLRV
jgi:mevalonate kinase